MVSMAYSPQAMNMTPRRLTPMWSTSMAPEEVEDVALRALAPDEQGGRDLL
jgi:hypothetical protein